MEVKQKKKSIFVAYILWLFGGIFGLHLFYLGRDVQAFLYWSTLGGYVGIGWLFDLFYIPGYVRDANEDERFVEEFIATLKKNRKPPFSSVRCVAALVISYLWAQLIQIAIPEDEYFGINWKFLQWLIPLGAALGTWAVGNIGRECGSIKWPLVTAYACYCIRFFYYSETVWFNVMVVATVLVFDSFSKDWRRKPRQKSSTIRRVTILTTCGILYLALWGSYLYFNGTITDSEGEKVPINEALHHFFTSPWWSDFKQSLKDVWVYAQHHGWYEVWKEIIDLSDPHGEQNAYKVLNVTPSASQAEITAKWRALSREHHPDKVKDPELRRAAQERFMEIQQAYDIVSNVRSKRNRRNKKFE